MLRENFTNDNMITIISSSSKKIVTSVRTIFFCSSICKCVGTEVKEKEKTKERKIKCIDEGMPQCFCKT